MRTNSLSFCVVGFENGVCILSLRFHSFVRRAHSINSSFLRCHYYSADTGQYKVH